MRKIFLLIVLIFFTSEVFSQANLLNAKNPLEIGDTSSSEAITEFVDYEYVDDKVTTASVLAPVQASAATADQPMSST